MRSFKQEQTAVDVDSVPKSAPDILNCEETLSYIIKLETYVQQRKSCEEED